MSLYVPNKQVMVKGHNCTPFPERNNQIPDEKWIQRFINNKVNIEK
ncbi:hypothetical protein T11_8033, partial [Trichinella zimbabwensis]